jgi:hypothetical protein
MIKAAQNLPAAPRRNTRPSRDTPPDQRLKTPAVYFAAAHPLVEVAAWLCRAHQPSTRRRVSPCGPCWERAVRDDERIVTECGLSRELVPDPDHVDVIAVDLACRGERVSLTAAEFAAAVTRLRTQGVSDTQIAARLRRSLATVHAVLAAPTVPEVETAPAGRAA